MKNNPLTNIFSRGCLSIVISGRAICDFEKIQAIKRKIVIIPARTKMKIADKVLFLLKMYNIKPVIKMRLRIRLKRLPI